MIMVRTLARILAIATLNSRLVDAIEDALADADTFGVPEYAPERRLLNSRLEHHQRVARKLKYYAEQLTKGESHAKT